MELLVRKHVANEKVRTAIDIHMGMLGWSIHQLRATVQRQSRQNWKQIQSAQKIIKEKKAEAQQWKNMWIAAFEKNINTTAIEGAEQAETAVLQPPQQEISDEDMVTAAIELTTPLLIKEPKDASNKHGTKRTLQF